jgi:hypothetical protein
MQFPDSDEVPPWFGASQGGFCIKSLTATASSNFSSI